MLPIPSLIVVSALTAFATLAAAQSATPRTRADVGAEARAAVKSGTTAEGEIKEGAAPAPQGVAAKSRGEVKSEAKVAVKRGETAEGEISYRGPAGKTAEIVSVKSRAEIRNEARAAAKNNDGTNGEMGYSGQRKSTSGAAGR